MSPAPFRRVSARSAGVAAIASSIFASLAACGSRGPLDVDVVYVVDPDAAAPGADASVTDARADAIAADASADAPRGDARPDAPPSPIQCPACLFQQCGTEIAACLQSTSCRTVLQCAVQQCLLGGGGGDGGGGGGGLNPQCALKCANGDTGVLLQLVGVFTCITQKCGPDCGALLGGGLPGFPGGGTGGSSGGGGMPGGREGFAERRDMSIARDAFSPWPELATRF